MEKMAKMGQSMLPTATPEASMMEVCHLLDTRDGCVCLSLDARSDPFLVSSDH